MPWILVGFCEIQREIQLQTGTVGSVDGLSMVTKGNEMKVTYEKLAGREVVNAVCEGEVVASFERCGEEWDEVIISLSITDDEVIAALPEMVRAARGLLPAV